MQTVNCTTPTKYSGHSSLSPNRELAVRLAFDTSVPEEVEYPVMVKLGVPDSLDRHALFAEFQPLVQRLVRQYGDNHDMREDMIGEIYCRFCSVLDAYDPSRGIPLKPYLVHQLAYSVYSYVRRQWRRNSREISLEVETITKSLPNAGDVSQQWDDAMMMRKVQDGLPRVISQLSLRQRQVVIWRYYEARSFEEIADRLNIQLATARSTLRHALRNMRRKLQEDNLNYE